MPNSSRSSSNSANSSATSSSTGAGVIPAQNQAALKQYLDEIEQNLKLGNATEHTHRPALKTLIEKLFSGVTATNEPRRVAVGAPDYVLTKNQTPLGYIEAKDVGISLTATEKTPQLKRYREGLGNLVLTDYLEFRWYEAGQLKETARLANWGASGSGGSSKKSNSTGGGSSKLQPTSDGLAQVYQLLKKFMQAQVPTVKNSRELAERMAALAQIIRDTTAQSLKDGTEQGSSLRDQLESFKQVLIPGLTTDQFADMFAQTICYGLFAARFNYTPTADKPFDRLRASTAIPKTNPFLQKTFYHITGPELDERINWAVDNLAELLNRADIKTIMQGFGKATRQHDPVVHFYETFLAAYDPKMREARGVYYTPEPVVSYIVRSVDHLLKTSFDLKDGLADRSKISRTIGGNGHSKAPGAGGSVAGSPGKAKKGSAGADTNAQSQGSSTGNGAITLEAHRVQILDPATGTGTFLSHIISHIYETTYKDEPALWSSYVSQHLLPRLAGFELLMAPYSVAHLKLGLQLLETGYNFQSNERLRVYLTNTLEEGFESGKSLWAGWLKDEAESASSVKYDAPVMVVLGNPPYSGHSANNGRWINELLRGQNDRTISSYFEVDGQPLGERNPKWLNDDYVKFIRFAQWRIERTGYGILAYISNHGYLDNPTFRGMRQSLMNTFDDIYLLDLHGNSKRKEFSPDGSTDENVFDIQQGVAIGLFVKKPGSNGDKKPAAVQHAHLFGQRETFVKDSNGQNKLNGGKYYWLAENDLASTEWKSLTPQSPYYFFVPQDITLQQEYEQAWKITEFMPISSVNFRTHRDSLVIDFEREILIERIKKVRDKLFSDDKISQEFNLHNTRDWSLYEARIKLWQDDQWQDKIRLCQYRPFDYRWIFYDDSLVEYPSYSVVEIFGIKTSV